MTRKSRDCQFSSDFNTRSVDAVEQMNVLFFLRDCPDFSVIHSRWRQFPILTHVDFTCICPAEPCILSNVNIESRGTLKELTKLPNLTWQHFDLLSDYSQLCVSTISSSTAKRWCYHIL